MVYYLKLHSRTCIGIVGTLRTTRRSASASVQLHHPRGKRGNKDARRRAVEEAPVSGRPDDTGRPAPPSERTSGPHRTTDTSTPEPNQRKIDDTGRSLATGRPVPPQPSQSERKSGDNRTSGSPRATGRPVPSGRPVPVCVQRSGMKPMDPSPTYPFVDLDYIYSSTSS